MNLRSKWVGIAAGAVLGIVVVSFLRRGGAPSPDQYSLASALKELRNPHNDERSLTAVAALQRHGDAALSGVVELLRNPTRPESCAYALNVLTSLPASPKVINTHVDLMDSEQDGAIRERLRQYLEAATEQQFGTNAQAWQRWWEQDGKSRTSFKAPYGTPSVEASQQQMPKGGQLK